MTEERGGIHPVLIRLVIVLTFTIGMIVVWHGIDVMYYHSAYAIFILDFRLLLPIQIVLTGLISWCAIAMYDRVKSSNHKGRSG